MRVTQRVVGQAVVILLEGKLVFKMRKIYQQALKEAQEKSPRKIVLNLEGVTYVDSAGLGLIALTSEQTKIEHIAFGIAGAKGAVKRILEMANFQKMMMVCETETEALRLAPPVLAPLA